MKYQDLKAYKRIIQDDKNILYLPRQNVGEPGIGGTCEAETGQIAALGKVGYYGFTTSEETKKEPLF